MTAAAREGDVSRDELIEALEEAEERYLNHCNTPLVRARELVYRDVIVEFVGSWLDDHVAVVPRRTGGLDNAAQAWRQEMGA